VETPVETVETRTNEEKKTPEAVVETHSATETQETTQQPAENAPVETASQPEAGASSEVVSEGAHEQASVQMETPVTQVEGESVTAKEELAITEEEAERVLSRLPSEKSFRFYVGLGQPAGPWASSLKEFCDLIEIVDVKSVEFHTFRSDFENWFRDALNYPQLAEEIAKIRETGITGGELREQIYKTAKKHYDQLNRVIEETLEIVTQPAEQVIQPVETVEEETKAQPSQEETAPAPETTAETASPLPTEEQPITVKIVTIEETTQETPSSLGESIPPDQTLIVENLPIAPQVEKPAETVIPEQPQTTSPAVADIEPPHAAPPTRPTNCHKCGAQIDTSKKQWTFESRKTHMKFLIYLYKCPACGASFRESVKEETAPTLQVV